MKTIVSKIREQLPSFPDCTTPYEVLESFKDYEKALPTHADIDLGGGRIIGNTDFLLQPYTMFTGTVFIGKNVFIGPYCLIRGPVFIGDGVRIGPHSEIIRSIILNDTKIGHRALFADSIIGCNVKIAASFTIANVMQADKNIKMSWHGKEIDIGSDRGYGAIIGDNAEIGANVLMMPGSFIPDSWRVIGPSIVDRKGKVKSCVGNELYQFSH